MSRSKIVAVLSNSGQPLHKEIRTSDGSACEKKRSARHQISRRKKSSLIQPCRIQMLSEFQSRPRGTPSFPPAQPPPDRSLRLPLAAEDVVQYPERRQPLLPSYLS